MQDDTEVGFIQEPTYSKGLRDCWKQSMIIEYLPYYFILLYFSNMENVLLNCPL